MAVHTLSLSPRASSRISPLFLYLSPSLAPCLAIITLSKAAVAAAAAMHRRCVSHPCLIHDLQGDFIRQRLRWLPFPAGYSAKVPENCKCFTTPSSDLPRHRVDSPRLCPSLPVSVSLSLCVLRTIQDEAMALFAADMEISYTAGCAILLGWPRAQGNPRASPFFFLEDNAISWPTYCSVTPGPLIFYQLFLHASSPLDL